MNILVRPIVPILLGIVALFGNRVGMPSGFLTCIWIAFFVSWFLCLLGTKEQELKQYQPPADGISGLVKLILDEMRQMGATRAIIQPEANCARTVYFKGKEQLAEGMTIPKAVQKDMVKRLKQMAAMDLANESRPQKGRIEVADNNAKCFVRAQTYFVKTERYCGANEPPLISREEGIRLILEQAA